MSLCLCYHLLFNFTPTVCWAGTNVDTICSYLVFCNVLLYYLIHICMPLWHCDSLHITGCGRCKYVNRCVWSLCDINLVSRISHLGSRNSRARRLVFAVLEWGNVVNACSLETIYLVTYWTFTSFTHTIPSEYTNNSKGNKSEARLCTCLLNVVIESVELDIAR